jgi:hypothetical protein
MSKEDKIEARCVIKEHALKAARDCEQGLDKTHNLWPAEMQKYYSRAKRECWRDWRELQNLPDED